MEPTPADFALEQEPVPASRTDKGVGSGPWLAVPKDWRTHYRGKGCQCNAYGESECACGADWTDPEIYRLRNMINELRQCVTTDHESKAIFIARVNAILSANVTDEPCGGRARSLRKQDE